MEPPLVSAGVEQTARQEDCAPATELAFLPRGKPVPFRGADWRRSKGNRLAHPVLSARPSMTSQDERTRSWAQTRSILRVLLLVLGVAALLALAVALRGILLLATLAVFFAYLLAPAVDAIDRP